MSPLRLPIFPIQAIGKNLIAILALFAVYFLAAKVGLALASIHPSASAVWPPAGIAVAALLLFGYRLWPGIFLGAFLANLLNFGGIFTSFGIAAGNTLEALAAVYLLHRYTEGARFFEQIRDIFKFFGISMLAPFLSATIGVSSLSLAGLVPAALYDQVWLTWWLGDIAGILIIAPLIIIWVTHKPERQDIWRNAEMAAAFTGLIATSLVIFTDILIPNMNYPLAFLTIPPLIWIATRFSLRAGAGAVFLVTLIAHYGNMQGAGPFVLGGHPNSSLMLLQAFIAFYGMTMYVLSAAVNLHKQDKITLARLNKNKDEFLAILAHELRNPLAPIVNTLELIRLRGVKDPELAKDIDTIDRQFQNIIHLLTNFLDTSRLIHGKITVELKRIEVHQMVRLALETSRPLFEKMRHEVTISFSMTPLYVMADAMRLEQVIVNVLNNAAKYTPSGGHIWVTVEHTKREALIRVKDTGIGIPPEMIDKIFTLFSQGDQRKARLKGGMGIGLMLVKNLVELQGGRVEVKSEGPNKGSEFIIRMPLLKEEKTGTVEKKQVTEAPLFS